MGWWGGGHCLATPTQAAQALCASLNVAGSGGYSKCEWPSAGAAPASGQTYVAGEVWITHYAASTGASVRTTVAVQIHPCDDAIAGPLFPWNLSIAEGAQISAAILGVWALAWCLRALRRALSSDGISESE